MPNSKLPADADQILLASTDLPLCAQFGLLGLFSASSLDAEQLAEAVVALARAESPASTTSSEEAPALWGSRRFVEEVIDVAAVWVVRGRLEEAELLLRRGEEAARSARDNDGHLTLKIQSALARTLVGRGRYDEARRLLLTTVESQRILLGTAHEDTLETLESLGELLLYQGELYHAEPLLEEVLGLRLRLEGRDAIATLRLQVTLARLWSERGLFQAAKLRLGRLLSAAKALEYAPLAVYAGALYGMAQKNLGDLIGAQKTLSEAVASAHATFGISHVLTAQTQEQLAGVLMALGENQKAADLIDTIQQAQARVGQADYLLATKLLVRRGRALMRVGNFQGAETSLVSGYERLRQAFGLLHNRTQKALSELVKLYVTMGKNQKVAEYRKIMGALS